MEDRQIVELYMARDEAAIRESEQKYGSYCYSVSYHILSDPADTEECVNDTWLKAWNSIPPEKPNSLKLYLARIVRNLSLDRYRERHRDKRGGGETALALSEIEGTLTDCNACMDAESLCTLLNRFLGKLPEREAGIFIRRYFYMEGTQEIAKRYGLREGHVLTILSRTRKKLKDFLSEEGYPV